MQTLQAVGDGTFWRDLHGVDQNAERDQTTQVIVDVTANLLARV
jgi:hypothetical protein